jgi:hypothetical protein
LDEDFDAVTGVGGGVFLSGGGLVLAPGWDTGITGEKASAGTTGYTQIDASALGDSSAGVGGTGAGVLDISGLTFNVFEELFSAATGTGGGVFLAGGGGANTAGATSDWDDGISGESASGSTFGGAILNGSMSAEGLSGSDRGQLDVDNVDVTSGNWNAALRFAVGNFPGGAALLNSGFEEQPAGFGAGSWTVFGNVYTCEPTNPFVQCGDPGAPNSGEKQAKMYGNFTGAFNSSGVYQQMTAVPGQTWEIDSFSRHLAGDSLAGTSNYMAMKIEYYDPNGTMLLEGESVILDANSPTDTWIDNTPFSLTAPAGTSEVRPVIIFVQPAVAFELGAGLVDDVRMRVISGPGPVDTAATMFTADVTGTVDAGGETLGNYTLRLEDEDGNGLEFSGTASGAQQSIGGALSGASDVGGFNYSSSSFTAVIEFDNAGANPWGTGGTLEVDNVVLTNENQSFSDWSAKLLWDGLVIALGDPNTLSLTADIKGSVSGGKYELRIGGIEEFAAGLDENFATITETGGATLLDPNDSVVCGGGTCSANGSSDNWDDGVSGESAFAVLNGMSSEIFFGGGFFADGVTDPNTGDTVGQISVGGVLIGGPGAGWGAGLEWRNQGLASTDLSQVTLSANIRGRILDGTLGDFELRIEDAQGDRLVFSGTATTSFQAVGGTLDTATPVAGAGGNGIFETDSSAYSVVVAFANPAASWGSGGILQVDDLFLTTVDVKTEIGSITFAGTADGTFQSVGGLLNTGGSTFGDFEEAFETASGLFGPAGFDDWDTGLEGEHAFFGTFGSVTVDPNNGGALPFACPSCGVGGTKAATLTVDGLTFGAGAPGGVGWFAGVYFQNLTADLSGDLSQIALTADIKGEALPGGTLGTYFLRVEDEDLTVLSFTILADGTTQTAGGTLDTATLEQIESGDGIFNRNQDTYTVTVGFVGDNAGNWGPAGKLTVDNITLPGIHFEDADTYTVSIGFVDELSSWGSGGGGVDPCAVPGGDADLNDDGVVNITDLGIVLAHFGMGGATHADGDTDGSGTVNITDLGNLLSLFGTTGCLNSSGGGSATITVDNLLLGL